MSTCDDVSKFVQAVRQILERDDLRLEQRREIAGAFEIDTGIVVDTD